MSSSVIARYIYFILHLRYLISLKIYFNNKTKNKTDQD